MAPKVIPPSEFGKAAKFGKISVTILDHCDTLRHRVAASRLASELRQRRPVRDVRNVGRFATFSVQSVNSFSVVVVVRL